MKDKKGFTLIEIIAAVIILGIISITALITYTNSMKDFRDSYYESLSRTVMESGREFFEDNRNYRPSTIFSAQKVPISLLESRSYIDDIKDYNGHNCDRSSYVIAIKTGRNDFIYHTCLVCSEDTFSNMDDKYCDSAWEDSSTVKYTLADIKPIYVYKNSSREKLREKLTLAISIAKYDRNNNLLATVDGDGVDDVPTILPYDMDVVDTSVVKTYTVHYKYEGITKERKVHVYESEQPGVNITYKNVYAKKIERDTVTTGVNSGNYTSGSWVQEVTVKFIRGTSGNADVESGVNVSQYQWNKGGKWDTFCNSIDPSDNSCTITYRQEMNEEISFRTIDAEGNISKKTSPITIRIDRTVPTCTMKRGTGTLGTNDWFTSNVQMIFDVMKDQVNSSVPEAKSDLMYTNIRKGATVFSYSSKPTANTSAIEDVDEDYVYYYGFVEDRAQNYATCSNKVRRDVTNPRCDNIADQAKLKCSDATSKLIRVYFGQTDNSTTGEALNKLSSWEDTRTVNNTGRCYLKVTDDAGLTYQTSDMYYLVTYNRNGGDSGPTKTSEIRRNTTLADLTPTARKVAYKMIGWNTNASATSALGSHSVTNHVTLYAIYVKCAKGQYTDAVGTQCLTCPAGYRDGEPVGRIEDCKKDVPAGNYVKNEKDSTPTECTGGYYKTAETITYGQKTQCIQCPDGYRDGTALANKLSQDKCLRNMPKVTRMASPRGTTNTACQKGEYKAAHTVTYGATSSCSSCPEGYRDGDATDVIGNCIKSVPANNYVKDANGPAVACPTGYHSSAHTVKYGTKSSCTPNTYYIAFNGNGNTGGSTATATCTYDSNCTLTANGFSKTAHTFTGWATTSGGSVAYSNGQAVKNLATSGTVTLYAKWRANCKDGWTYIADTNKCRKTYTATSYYTCPSGGTLSGSTCTISGSYAATATSNGYSGGCDWDADGGNYRTNQTYPSGLVSSLGDCDASNNGAQKKKKSCTNLAYLCGSTYRCKSYGSSCKKSNADTRVSEWKVYTCTCSGSITYSYSCPSGGTLSGTTCYTSSSYTGTLNYSCNSGDSRSGTTCTNEYTPT